MGKAAQAVVIAFPKKRKRAEKARKSGLNHNREGSVRNVNGTVYVDFMYLDERVRESSGLPWTDVNAKSVREQLDRIVLAIKDSTFRFAEVFPESKKAGYFAEKEKEAYGLKTSPDNVLVEEYAWVWFELLESSGRISGRTLREYKSYIDNYLIPFFGKVSFSEIDAHLLEEFVAWARKRKLKRRSVCNKSINKYMVPMKMLCKKAALKFKWGINFDRSFGIRGVKEAEY